MKGLQPSGAVLESWSRRMIIGIEVEVDACWKQQCNVRMRWMQSGAKAAVRRWRNEIVPLYEDGPSDSSKDGSESNEDEKQTLAERVVNIHEQQVRSLTDTLVDESNAYFTPQVND